MRGKICPMMSRSGKVNFIFAAVCLPLIFLLGCAGGANDSAEEPQDDAATLAGEVDSVETEENEAKLEEAQEEPTATPTPSPTATPTPFPAELVLGKDDVLFVEDEIVVEQLSSPENGWLVVWPDTGAALVAEDALAHIEVDAGADTDIVLPIDSEGLTVQAVQIALHGGRTEEGSFAADGSNLLLIETLAIETAATRPMLQTSAEVISDDGFLRIDEVRSNGPAWVAVYDADQENLLGFKAIPAGPSADVDVPVQWHNATTILHLYLLADAGNVGEFEIDVDEPVLIDGEPLTLELAVGLPAEIVVFDQPMIDRAVVGRVTSPVDGHIAVFGDSNADGFPDTIIGSAPIAAGLSEFVEVELDANGVTTSTVFSLYTDSVVDGEFDYFGDDPVLVSDGVSDPVPLFVPARSDVEGMLVVDHLSTAEAVNVVWVATTLDSWLVVEKLPVASGELAVPVGLVQVAAGLQNNLMIPLEGVSAGDSVRVMLYINNPDFDLFDPERNDFPLQANNRLVFVEFELK